MARKPSKTEVSRRKFLAGAAVAGAATALPGVKAARAHDAAAAFVKRPSTAAAAAEMAGTVPASPGTLGGPAGSDFMVDVLRSLDIDFVFSNPASSCRGIHESIVNYGGNKKPEFITCMHEESAVAMTPWLFQGRGQTGSCAVPRHGRPAARGHGGLQRVVRPRRVHHHGRQPHGRRRRASRAFPPSMPCRTRAR